jgi:hypothetical protein
MDILVWLEQTSLATWVRESPSLWAYPTILFLHTLGLGFLVGANAAVDFRILGVAPRLPLAPMEKFFPVMIAGFWINAISGAALLVADASTMLLKPVFLIKFLFIVLAVVDIQIMKRVVFHDPAIDKKPVSLSAKSLALASILFWFGAITAGRLTAYL